MIINISNQGLKNFTIEYAKDLRWHDAEHTMFNCTVKYAEIDRELPCSATPQDEYSHIEQLWQRGLAGEFGTIAEKQNTVNT